MRAIDEIERGAEEFLVDRLHALLRQRPGVLALLLAPRPEARIVAGRLRVGRDAFHHAARAEARLELRVLRIVGVLRLFFGVEVVEIAEELVEAVHGRQKLVAVAEMVLAELSGHVALRLEQFGERRILVRQTLLRRGEADLEQAGADRALAGDEGGAPGGAGLLRVIVGEEPAFVGDAVDVGRAIAHHAAIVGADVPVADVVAHDDEDVGLLRLDPRAAIAAGAKARTPAPSASAFANVQDMLFPPTSVGATLGPPRPAARTPRGRQTAYGTTMSNTNCGIGP